MPVIVKNIGTMNPPSAGSHGNTKNSNVAVGNVGTVRAIYQNQEYVFGPNEAKTFQDDGIGYGVAAFNSNLTAYPQNYWR